MGVAAMAQDLTQRVNWTIRASARRIVGLAAPEGGGGSISTGLNSAPKGMSNVLLNFFKVERREDCSARAAQLDIAKLRNGDISVYCGAARTSV